MTLLIIALSVTGGVFLLGYCGMRWDRRIERVAARFVMHVAGILAPADADEAAKLRSFRSDIESPSAESAALPPIARPLWIRSSSSIGFANASQTGLVSVVIPTHNRAQLTGRAIESALSQTYDRLEVVVADDGSTDDTRAVAESFGPRVVYLRQANAGVSAARNFGMRNTRGEFIAFLDSDDAWRPWKIEAQLAALKRQPAAGLVWTDMEAVDEADRIIYPRYLRTMYSAYQKVDIETTLGCAASLGALSADVPKELSSSAVREGDLSSAILLGNLIHTSTVLFRRTWCEWTGGFDESYARSGEDYEFYIRLTSAGRVVFIDAPSTLYRIGAADQLTAPSMLVEIARNNLRAIQKWVPRSDSLTQLPPRVIRTRFAESFAWLGEAELEAGHSWLAARRLSKSLAVMPALDKRAALLASCAVPRKVRDGLRSARSAILSNARARNGRGTSV